MRRRCPKCGGTIWRLGKGEHPYYCNNCKARFTEPEVTVPPTNGERIRAMTDEELAEFMAKNVGCDECRFFATCLSAPQDRACPEKWLDWLKQEKNK